MVPCAALPSRPPAPAACCLPPSHTRWLYETFVKQPGPRRCAGAFCTFTDSTKKAVGEKRFNQFCSNGVLNFMMINSPGGPRKADDSDHPLKEVGVLGGAGHAQHGSAVVRAATTCKCCRCLRSSHCCPTLVHTDDDELHGGLRARFQGRRAAAHHRRRRWVGWWARPVLQHWVA
jgi:hypothetical protein